MRKAPPIRRSSSATDCAAGAHLRAEGRDPSTAGLALLALYKFLAGDDLESVVCTARAILLGSRAVRGHHDSDSRHYRGSRDGGGGGARRVLPEPLRPHRHPEHPQQ
jgi:hypothetical protein